jgi:hypothetical protein
VEKTRELLLSLGAQPRIDATLLCSLQQPVCLALGDRDEMVTLQETASAFAELSSGALAVLPQTPHPFEKISLSTLAFHSRRFYGNSSQKRSTLRLQRRLLFFALLLLLSV